MLRKGAAGLVESQVRWPSSSASAAVRSAVTAQRLCTQASPVSAISGSPKRRSPRDTATRQAHPPAPASPSAPGQTPSPVP
ncbi:hypothetical protein DI270_032295 [Microbispora triticiradicis]|uniref:Uncharacterized protein n=3 Tax=Microbispora TaxID=2005 RepID=A0ABY3LW17_9ACTN|nr:hypothetical protein DI270_032295 [Microbispora triticiradicis]TLP55673.1 hypothetical protein FED44_24830 [Microbispora fusca]TYB57341.1 hypothetical protein FXF59_18915 [Microbispora tritici]